MKTVVEEKEDESVSTTPHEIYRVGVRGTSILTGRAGNMVRSDRRIIYDFQHYFRLYKITLRHQQPDTLNSQRKSKMLSLTRHLQRSMSS